ncbi:MAG: hypothetical protein IKN53_05850, partial [Oscillibacter sp.]|nr:hypothetical protein [Oscillibacter sp.]
LLEYLGKLSEENPVLEQSPAPELLRAYAQLRQRAAWIDGGAFGATFAHGEVNEEVGVTDRELESLQAFLRDQLERLHLPERLLLLCKYLAELVDEDGYLAQEDLDDLHNLRVPEELIEQGLATIQSLEPAGIGARTLSECLLLQLRRRDEPVPYAEEIAERFLDKLGRGHDGPILKALNITPAQLRAAEAAIAELESRPGRAFEVAEPTVYVRPDVFVVELDGELQVILNEYYLPRITVSPYYRELAKSSDERETRDYLNGKLRQAKWLLDSLSRRGSTLKRCAQAILDAQRPFFEGKSSELVPMKLSSLAADLRLNPSTISRAVGGKYLQCRQGTYPMRYFFSRAVAGGGSSRQAVKQGSSPSSARRIRSIRSAIRRCATFWAKTARPLRGAPSPSTAWSSASRPPPCASGKRN